MGKNNTVLPAYNGKMSQKQAYDSMTNMQNDAMREIQQSNQAKQQPQNQQQSQNNGS